MERNNFFFVEKNGDFQNNCYFKDILKNSTKNSLTFTVISFNNLHKYSNYTFQSMAVGSNVEVHFWKSSKIKVAFCLFVFMRDLNEIFPDQEEMRYFTSQCSFQP